MTQPILEILANTLPSILVALIIGVLTFVTTKNKVKVESLNTYANTAQTAIESQNLLQHQINGLRDEAVKKDQQIEVLASRIVTLEAEKERLKEEMSQRDETIERLVMLTHAQEKEIKQLKAKTEKSDTEKARRLSKAIP